MVIGHLGVVHETASQRALAGARRELVAIRRFNRRHNARQRLRHFGREVPAIRARVTDEFVPLVERLCQVERLLRAEAEQAVGVPLQLRQIVEQRRPGTLPVGLDRFDGGASAARALDDLPSLGAVLGKPRGVLPSIAEPCALKGGVVGAARGPERRHHLDIILGHKTADRQLALYQHGQRRRLDAPDR